MFKYCITIDCVQLQIVASVARLHVSMHVLDAALSTLVVRWYLIGLPQWLMPRRILIASKVLYRQDFYNALLAYFSKFIYIHVHDAVTHIFHFSPTHRSPDRNRMLCHDVCAQAWGPWKLQLCRLKSVAAWFQIMEDHQVPVSSSLIHRSIYSMYLFCYNTGALGS